MKKDKGFTLIEIVITICLISILSAIIVPNYIAYVDRAKMQKANYYASLMNEIVLNSYYEEDGIVVEKINNKIGTIGIEQPAKIEVDNINMVVKIAFISYGKEFICFIYVKEHKYIFA